MKTNMLYVTWIFPETYKVICEKLGNLILQKKKKIVTYV